MSVVRLARQRCKQAGPYDTAYCVFDRDNAASFEEARETIRQVRAAHPKSEPLEEAISVPCIEFWFLLHWAYSTAPYENCDAAHRALRAQMPNYAKNDRDVSDQLSARLATAIANATRLEAAKLVERFDNPDTSVHTVARRIRDMGAATLP